MDRTVLRITRALIPRLLVVLGTLLGSLSLSAAAIPVRFSEGSVHGFLVLRTQQGRFLAQGDLLEVTRGSEVQKTTVFRFQDGSLFRETVVFSQKGVYTLQSYRLEQRGPTFTEDTKISLDRATGNYRVVIEPRTGSPAKVLEGRLDFPPDLYNGMISTVVRDLPAGAAEIVHLVAFTPAPKIVELEIAPAGRQTMVVGEASLTAVHYVLKARLGTWLKMVAAVLGRVPEDGHVWVIDGEVPAFVGFEGQLYTMGPVWRIDLVSPARPQEVTR